MIKLNFKKSFMEKKFRYGGYATLVTAVVLAILLIVNLLVGQLNWKVDLTKNKLFSLSEQSDKILDELNKDITIYVFEEPGKEDPVVKTILEKYTTRSNKVKIEYKDPVKYPALAKQYNQNGNDVSQGSIVVSADSKFKLIGPEDLMNYSYDQYGQTVADSIAIEQRITGAMIYITSTETPIVYTLKGHEEEELPADITKQMEFENYTVKDLNLLLKSATLTPGSTLFVVSPKRDISNDELTTIKDFLLKGGKAIFFMDIVNVDMPNFQSILNTYGIGVKRTVVVEGDPNYSAGGNPVFLVPDMGGHEIVNLLKSGNLPVLIPGAQALELKDLKKSTTTIEPLLTTSKNSWGKANLNASTVEKQAGDFQGPFTLAVAVTDAVSSEINTKLVVVSNGLFVDPQYVANGGNIDFVMNSISWLQDKKDNISIRPKSLMEGNLNINDAERLLLSGVVVIVIPAAIAVLGIMIWLRRKRK